MLENIYVWTAVITLILLIYITETNGLKYQYSKNSVVLAVVISSLLWPLFYLYCLSLFIRNKV